MSERLDKYLKIDEAAFYINDRGEKKFRGVDRRFGDTVRNDKAAEQAKKDAVDPKLVYKYVNEILELFREVNGYTKPNKCRKNIPLDGIDQAIIDNGIIVKGCTWKDPVYSEERKDYTSWDPKYDEIAEAFDLKCPRNIVWIKFTKNGHVGVVAKSVDINYDCRTSSGKLVKEVGEEWDESFVFIFPLTREILGRRRSGDPELATGNYLIEKEVPIIDYYSHYNQPDKIKSQQPDKKS